MNNKVEKVVSLLFAAVLSSSAQAYTAGDTNSGDRQMLAENKIWICIEYDLVDESRTFLSEYTVGGDTVIGGVACRKCYVRSDRLKQETPQFMCGLMEDGSHVYTVSDDGLTLLCDFGLQAGESITVTEGGTDYVLEVTAIDYVDGGSGPLRRQTVTVKMWQEERTMSWIEGVGPAISPLCTPSRLFFTSSYGERVTDCQEDGKSIFKAEGFNLDGTQGISSLSPSVSSPLLQLFDLQGRRLSGTPARGLYIQDGRKHAVR